MAHTTKAHIHFFSAREPSWDPARKYLILRGPIAKGPRETPGTSGILCTVSVYLGGLTAGASQWSSGVAVSNITRQSRGSLNSCEQPYLTKCLSAAGSADMLIFSTILVFLAF